MNIDRVSEEFKVLFTNNINVSEKNGIISVDDTSNFSTAAYRSRMLKGVEYLEESKSFVRRRCVTL